MNDSQKAPASPAPPTCKLCGEPMPAGEEMFYYHGYSGPCPKPPMERAHPLAHLPEKHPVRVAFDRENEVRDMGPMRPHVDSESFVAGWNACIHHRHTLEDAGIL